MSGSFSYFINNGKDTLNNIYFVIFMVLNVMPNGSRSVL